MSFPPGFLDELRSRTSLARVIGRKVTWDQRKSNQGKGDLWASCPFHQEKSASFHVDDRQGFYYCFGCHAKGDAISFVRESENVGFMEAVEILAKDAGMQMPAADPRAKEKSDRHTQLAEVMEQAAQWFRLQLKTGGAGAARDYLVRRGLADSGQQRFEIGWAPDNRTALTEALKGRGVPLDLIVAAGLAAEPDGGGAPYDRFRGRIIFPIRDGRGRCIAFGGRSMDPNARAKYLNSPETELFDKGRNLYNHAPAREAAGKGQTLVVAEGYMDVIALSEAGFTASVAPLGTAVTADQLQLMWRIADEPVIALDGDTAGIRAARRVIDLALPLLEAGKSLRFALLPEGQDPDDLIKAHGREAMQGVLDGAQPMVRLLWQRETEGKSFDSPERRAALDRDLRDALKRIADPSIRRHYGDEIARLRQELFRPAQAAGTRNGGYQGGYQGRGNGRWKPRGPSVLASTRASALAALPDGGEEHLRSGLVLAVLCACPHLAAEYESHLERMDPADPSHASIRLALLRHAHDDDPANALAKTLDREALERLRGEGHIRIAPAARPDAPEVQVRACLSEQFAKLAAARAVRSEVGDAVEDISDLVDEGLTWRLSQAAEARNRAIRAEAEDRTVYDIAENGVHLDRTARDEARKIFEEAERLAALKRSKA